MPPRLLVPGSGALRRAVALSPLGLVVLLAACGGSEGPGVFLLGDDDGERLPVSGEGEGAGAGEEAADGEAATGEEEGGGAEPEPEDGAEDEAGDEGEEAEESGAVTDAAARGAWLADALSACTLNFLWLKDATGDLNAGPDLGAGYPQLVAVDGDRLTFATETIGMYSGGGLRGELVLQVTALDLSTGEAVIEGALTGGALTLRLGPQTLGPTPLILEDATVQSPSAPAFVDFPDGRVHPASWGLVFSPWSSAGNPVCVARAMAMGF